MLTFADIFSYIEPSLIAIFRRLQMPGTMVQIFQQIVLQ
nr:MAG TPA: hypothetical protein [Caudoviricetes sp.]